MYEGHQIAGTWLDTLGCETDIIVAAPVFAGGDVDLPYSSVTNSGVATARGNDYQIQLTIAGQYASEAYTSLQIQKFRERVQAVGKLIINDGEPYLLTRRLVTTTGDLLTSTYVKYQDGFETQRAAPPVARLAVRLKKLWPYFYGPSGSASAPGSITPGGSATTNRLVITMSGGTGQVLANTTTGESITITAGSGTIVIDPFSRTATRGGVNNIGSVAFAGPKNAWMRMVPGANTFTLNSGTASITYYPAWL